MTDIALPSLSAVWLDICPSAEMEEILKEPCVGIPDGIRSDTDAVARDQLYGEFAPLVRRLIRKYGEDKDTREDLVGEIYVRYCALIDAYDPARGVPLHPYIVRRLSMATYTFVRQRWILKRREAFGEAEVAVAEREATFDPTEDWLSALATEQTAALLPSALARLPARQRNVVIQRYYEGRSFEEIAETMGIKPVTARSFLRHALNKLRKAIEAMDDL